MLAFDAITSPTKFVIVNGFASNTTATPPGGATGNFGGSAVFAHVIELSGANVLDWTASTGTATLTAGQQGAACPDFTEFNGVTCFASSLNVAFQMTSSSPPSIALPSKTASMGASVIPAVQLRRDSSF